MRDFYVEERIESIPKFIKMNEEVKVKEKVLNSILKDWKQDTTGIYKKIIEYDQQFWKVQKYIKEDDEYDEFINLVQKNMFALKELFIHVATKEDWPTIGVFTTETMCENMGLIDNKVIQRSDIDRLFITANYEDIKHEDNPSNAFCRYEFIEFFSRLARLKYKETEKVVSTNVEAFQRLLDDFICPYVKEQCLEGHVFREKFLLRNVIDHTLHANKKGFEAIYLGYTKTNKKKIFN